MPRYTSLSKVNSTALVNAVLASFGTSYDTPAKVVQGIRAVTGNEKPNLGISKTVFENVNKLLESENLDRVSFSSLRPVLYNMIQPRSGAKKDSMSIQRHNEFQNILNKRFNKSEPKERVIEVKHTPKPEPQVSPSSNKKDDIKYLMDNGFSLSEIREILK
jgi:hypothetical protein